MFDEVKDYRSTPLYAALGRGTIYTILGVLLLAGLIVTLILGMQGIVGPGLFTGETAFAVGGLSVAVLSVATLVLLFSLGGTIRLIQREMAQLTVLREAIETSYSRLRDSATNLGREVGELRVVLTERRQNIASKSNRKD